MLRIFVSFVLKVLKEPCRHNFVICSREKKWLLLLRCRSHNPVLFVLSQQLRNYCRVDVLLLNIWKRKRKIAFYIYFWVYLSNKVLLQKIRLIIPRRFWCIWTDEGNSSNWRNENNVKTKLWKLVFNGRYRKRYKFQSIFFLMYVLRYFYRIFCQKKTFYFFQTWLKVIGRKQFLF
jgi:hypothetical protein